MFVSCFLQADVSVESDFLQFRAIALLKKIELSFRAYNAIFS